jgi:hypothetical protein
LLYLPHIRLRLSCIRRLNMVKIDNECVFLLFSRISLFLFEYL